MHLYDLQLLDGIMVVVVFERVILMIYIFKIIE